MKERKNRGKEKGKRKVPIARLEAKRKKNEPILNVITIQPI